MQETNLYEYAAIRYVPRVEREEFVNVGLVMMCKRAGWCKAAWQLPGSGSFIAPCHSPEELARQLEAFSIIAAGRNDGGPVAMLPVEERFRWLTAVKSSCLQTSRPHPGKCSDLKATFRNLYSELVAPLPTIDNIPAEAPSLGFIEALAREAGCLAMRYFRHKETLDVAVKFNDSDIVTRADKECDSLIRESIISNFPDHAILSEENGSLSGSAGWRWVIDPIDGTTNFASGIPLWAISIALEKDGVTMMGCVYLPALGEMYLAERGRGATCNGRRIHVSPLSDFRKAVVSTGFPVDRDVNPDNNLANFSRVLPLVRDVRRLGSAATDICYVAAGYLDGYWEMNLHEWDVAAALLILSEAGGEFSYFRSGRGVSVACASPDILKTLLPLLS